MRPSPTSEPYVRFSRIRLSSRQFPHRGVSRGTPGRVNGEQPGVREEGVWPARVVVSIPAAPSLERTFVQARTSVAGDHTLSIRLNHFPPLTPLTSAETMRCVHTSAAAHDRSWAFAPRLALAGTDDAVFAEGMALPHPPSCPPSLGPVLLAGLLAATGRSGTMRALTPDRLAHHGQVSPLTPHAFRASRPQPRDASRTSL